METWICGSLFVSPVQPYSRANAIVLAQMSIEQNRCAMACQGCDAVFLFLNKKAVETKS